jgi:signal transduction histidine kinase
VVVDLSNHAASFAGKACSPRLLDDLEADFARFDGHPDTAVAFAAAGRRARALAAAAGGDDAALRSAALAFAADAFTGLKLERSLPEGAAAEMISAVATALELPPLTAIEAQLGLLVALAPISDVSLWTVDPLGDLTCVVHVGDGDPTRRVRNAARAALGSTGEGGTSERGWIHSVPVRRWQQPYGALVVRARPDCRARALTFLQEAAALLSPVLERDMLLERNAERERALVESGERRLLRLGFDLHDGPLQDLVALAADVRLAQMQVSEHIGGRTGRLFAGRLEDLTSQISELDRTLRELAQSLEPTSVLDQPLGNVLEREVEAFERRSKTRVSLKVEGDLDTMTASQRIALYRILQEGLANVREHSKAKHVWIRVHGGPNGSEAEITDDGRGFEVAKTLITAAKRGRLGLVGMGERVRLLGGSFDVDSRPGGPTTLRLILPRWQPIATSQPSEPELEETF